MQSSKLIESEFIVKLTDMMKSYPEIVSWNHDGTQIHLIDTDKFCQKILPQYFRHSNFNSFIRQLNIYSFHKTKKSGKSLSFKNEYFKKGNQHNFFLIQRKRKFKELQNFQERFERQCQDLIAQVNSKSQITPEMKQTLITFLEYKYVSYVNLRRMKCELDALYKDLKDSRNKKVQDICAQLKVQLLNSISQLTSQSKKIDEFISKNFLKQSQQTKESLEPIQNQKILNQHIQNSINSNFQSMKSRSVMKEDFNEKYGNQELKENVRSFNSFPVFLEEFKTRKQQINFDHKLYNPFNSQNSFVFLPNYFSGPSQMPVDGKFNIMFQSKLEQNPEDPEKNMIFDDYEESLSASISFVKNLSDKESDDFSESN